MKKIWLFFVSGVFLMGCTSTMAPQATETFVAQVPEWYRDLETAFPSGLYLTAQGTGTSREFAEQQALASLAQIFSVSVVVESESFQRYKELQTGSGVLSQAETEVVQSIASKSAQNLLGVRFAAIAHIRDQEFHSLAYLDRTQASVIYLDILQRLWTKADEYSQGAQETTSALLRYGYLGAAVLTVEKAEELYAQYQVIDPVGSRANPPPFGVTEYSRLLSRVQQQIVLNLEISDNRDILRRPLTQEFTRRGFLVSSQTPTLTIRGRLDTREVPVGRQLSGIQWNMTLEVLDETSKIILGFIRTGNVSATGPENALLLAEGQALREIPEFFREFQGMIDRLVFP